MAVSATRNTAWSFAATAGSQAVTVATGVAIARSLGPSARGVLATATVQLFLITYLADAGLPAAFAYYSGLLGRGRSLLQRWVAPLTWQHTAMALLMGAPALVLLSWHTHTVALTTAIICLAFYAPGNFYSRYIMGIWQGAGDVRFHAMRFLSTATYAIGILALVSLRRCTPTTVLAAIVGSTILTAVVARMLVTRERVAPDAVAALPRLGTFRAYAARALIGTLSPLDAFQTDLLLLSLTFPAAVTGRYSVALSAASVIRMVGTSVAFVVVASVAGTSAERRSHLLGRAMRLSIAVSAVGALVLSLLARQALSLVYGRAFATAAPFVTATVIVAAAAVARQITSEALRGTGRAGAASILELSAFVSAVLLTVVGLTLWHDPLVVAYSVAMGHALALMASIRVLHSDGSRISLRLTHWLGDTRWLYTRVVSTTQRLL